MAETYEVKRNFSVGTTDLLHNSYDRYTNVDVPSIEDKVEALMCSSAIPGVFPY